MYEISGTLLLSSGLPKRSTDAAVGRADVALAATFLAIQARYYAP